MAREGVGEGDGCDPVLGGEGEGSLSSLTAQMPRNSATELSTASFLCIIFTGKGDIAEVEDQLE